MRQKCVKRQIRITVISLVRLLDQIIFKGAEGISGKKPVWKYWGRRPPPATEAECYIIVRNVNEKW